MDKVNSYSVFIMTCCFFGPTLDPYAEAFLLQAHCANPGGEEYGWWCVRVCARLKGEEGLSGLEQLCQELIVRPF